MTTLNILTKRIPAGGFGRGLTVAERRKLLDAGFRVHGRSVVIQDGADWIGTVYEPTTGGGLSSISGLRVRVAD